MNNSPEFDPAGHGTAAPEAMQLRSAATIEQRGSGGATNGSRDEEKVLGGL